MLYRKTILSLAILALLCCGAASTLLAQSLTQGNILGTVTDPSGAVVPGATVTLKNDSTGAAQTRTTTNSGFYEFALLPPGSYTLSVTAPSYQGMTQNVTASIGQVSTNNVRLAVASRRKPSRSPQKAASSKRRILRSRRQCRTGRSSSFQMAAAISATWHKPHRAPA